MSQESVKRYGVKWQTSGESEVARAVEQIRLVGYACVDGGYSKDEQDKFAKAFSDALAEQSRRFGGEDKLRMLDEHNTIRAPFIYSGIFLELAQNEKILKIVEELLGGSHATGTFVLNQQNGIKNPAGQGYNQGAYHRDLPYQHFWSSRPLAINALYCIDAFTKENGATLVVPGSHKSEPFPSDPVVNALAQQIEAPAGSFIILDCMVYHSGAANKSNKDRRAVNHVYSVPMIRQQIDIPSLLRHDAGMSDHTKKILGFGNPVTNSIEEYFSHRASRLSNQD